MEGVVEDMESEVSYLVQEMGLTLQGKVDGHYG